MISVCMATHNGAKWIETQIQSVLSQLGPIDELILVDDASSDNTLDLVRNLNDSRIQIFCNEQNLGVDKTFEKALSLAHGNTLFLCDQDDIWYPGKVVCIMKAFEENPGVTLALSDAQIIDKNGNAAPESYFDRRGKFIPGVLPNILKCKFLGCAMAVRSTMRDHFLPFPETIPGHDMWIGIVNEFYGKSLFISDPLIGYRRHGENISPDRRQGLLQMLIWRWQLVSNLTKRVARLAFSRHLDGS